MSIPVKEITQSNIAKSDQDWFNLKDIDIVNKKILRCYAGLDNFPIEIYKDIHNVSLAFGEHEYDLALTGYFLFSYSRELSEQFHINLILELSRIAKQVRIFPLHEPDGNLSYHLGSICRAVDSARLKYQIIKLDYTDQFGANSMLKIDSI